MTNEKIQRLQEQVRFLSSQGKRIALKSGGSSNTTRSKSYNNKGIPLDLRDFNRILNIDPEKQTAYIEPRVTMESLVRATLRHGLIPPVVPEFKGITVGGAINGCAGESGSHRWGIFSDNCLRYDVILGDGELISASPSENTALFHAIPGSYGALGLLVGAEIRLIPAASSVQVNWDPVSDPLITSSADFLDGIAFNRELIVKIEGRFTDEKPTRRNWYFEETRKGGEAILSTFDYLFRYDSGAFWIGAYLLKLPFLWRFISQGLLKFPGPSYFSEKEIRIREKLPIPNRFWLNLLSSQRLWKLHHKAESWVQNRLVIQDCSVPCSKAASFLNIVMDNPGVFPLWLCPIKNTGAEQIFAPHNLSEDVLNVGLYGIPAISAPMEQITKALERHTYAHKGRKVLYSRSYYTQQEFWKIYDWNAYQSLREKAKANNVWPDITEKVLSE